ncbi:hypothetical protein GGF37_003168 [Kickxella alabastrina]|nr:hypothetical protein GGF37_003168 [Kickxella alabastrina]
MPSSYVLIFERAGPETILYVSGNCYGVLGYTPEEMIGTSALNYSYDPHAKHYSCQWPADNPELGVTMLPHNMQCKDGRVIYVHAISINCTGHLFTVILAYPELGDIRVSESILYKLQYEVDFDRASEQAQMTSGCDTGSVVSVDTEATLESENNDIVYPKYPKVTRESLNKAHIYTARASRAKACFVLNRRVDESTQGPTVEFVTNSISNIFGGDIDSHEIIGQPLFTLVASADIAKAAMFLENLCKVTRPQLCSLMLKQNPSDGADSRVINVELFGAASDDKFVLLCQKKRRLGGDNSSNLAVAGKHQADYLEEEDGAPYMSLEEIISSDYDTTDIGEYWNELIF